MHVFEPNNTPVTTDWYSVCWMPVDPTMWVHIRLANGRLIGRGVKKDGHVCDLDCSQLDAEAEKLLTPESFRQLSFAAEIAFTA